MFSLNLILIILNLNLILNLVLVFYVHKLHPVIHTKLKYLAVAEYNPSLR